MARFGASGEQMEAPKFPTRVLNKCEYADAPEYVDIPEEHQQNRVEWGFNTLHIFTDVPKFRLPE